MTILLKGITAAATTVGLGGASLIGSNYAFPKSEIIAIAQTANEEWEKQLPKLADELKKSGNEGLAARIDTTTSATTLAFKSDPADSKEFNNQEKAKTAFKAWCNRGGTEDKELKDKLCKKKVKKGWLFGNNV